MSEPTSPGAPSAQGAPGPREETRTLFAFRLGEALFLCAAEAVEAVIATVAPLPLPRVPPHVLGLVDHDHRALAVLDLARFLAQPAAGDLPRTLVLAAGGCRVGVPVGAALGVVNVPAKALRGPSGAFGPRVEGFLDGECETPHGPGACLDLARLLEAARV